MNKTKIAIIGCGNIGKYTLEAALAAPDMELSGVVKRSVGGPVLEELAGIKMVQDANEPGPVGTALLCVSTRSVQKCVQIFPTIGIYTVDSFDTHTSIPELRAVLDQRTKEGGRVMVLSAGWDSGSDSVVRAPIQACVPKSIIYMNFGPGVSTGHAVTVKAVKGVKGVLSVTAPLGMGVYRRIVYVQLEDDANLVQVITAVRNDDYFVHDEIHMIQVPDISAVVDRGRGVRMGRKGIFGETDNQRFEFRMEINNPVLALQIMIAYARTVMRQQPGIYTMIEILVVDLLPGSRESAIATLV